MLQKLGFLPGFNKQVTETGAESQWTGGENVRFRYGTPEKIGGWAQLGSTSLCGPTRALHHMVNKTSIKYECDVNTIKTTYLHIENIQKPIKSASGYTIKELQELCKKLDIIITNEHGKNKLKNALYEEILTKV